MNSTKPLRDQELDENRSQRMRFILEAGYQLILDRGIVQVEMKDIADHAKISRATLYRYFPSKEALSFAILEHIATIQIIPDYFNQTEYHGTGAEKFGQFVKMVVASYRRFPDFYRFTAMLEAYFGSQYDAEARAQWYRNLYRALYVYELPKQFLEEGQRDGTVRKDIDPHLYFVTVLATVPIVAEHIVLNPTFAKVLYNLPDPNLLVDTIADALIRAVMPAVNPSDSGLLSR